MLSHVVSQAINLIQVPHRISVSGKAITPEILFGPTLAEPLVHWLSDSMSRRLLNRQNVAGEFIADPQHLMGMRWKKQTDISPSEYINFHGEASRLLILAEAISEIIEPARKNPQFDYADLLITFRDQVDFHYRPGDLVHPDDVHLHKILYNKLHSIRWQPDNLTNTPAKGKA